ncbi:MAG: TolC family protein, partial [Acidobacteria bacterium]|nr:TolC family protein [Acidobacteriota bacterium]
MIPVSRVIPWCALLILLNAPGAAQPVADSRNGAELGRLIAEAVERNAEIAEARAIAEAARQRVRPASALPDPMLSLGYENDGAQPSLGRQDMTRLQFMAQQALPFPGKQALAGRIAATEAGEVETRTARARLGVEAAVRRAYADILLARVYLGVV